LRRGRRGNRRSRRFWRSGGSRWRARARAFGDGAEQGVGLHHCAAFGRDLAEHAGARRIHFQGHLVGLKFDQRLVGFHRFAGFLEPAADRGLADGFP
jgi:hypothetical protein